MNLFNILGTSKPKGVVKEDYALLVAIAQEANIKKPHCEYDLWDMYVDNDELFYVSNDDLIQKELSDNTWLPVQFNGQTARLQIDDLIAKAIKQQNPDKVREIYLQWLSGDAQGPAFRYGSDMVLKFEFYQDIVKKNLKKGEKCQIEIKMKPNCYKCIHRMLVPGSAHSRCNNMTANVEGDEHGIRKGWFMWPLNYDPTWLVSCDGFSDDPKDKKAEAKLNPLIELMALLK